MDILTLNFTSEGWAVEAGGRWQGRCDRKGLYVMSHPYEPAQEGIDCRISRTVSLPDLPKGGSVWLRFYCSDGYIGCDRSNPEVGYEAENDPDCRYRRVCVNGQIVWEADVAGLNPPSAERFYTCDVTPHLNGSEAEIVFLVSDTRAVANKFATDVYWGLPQVVICASDESPNGWGPEDAPVPTLVAQPAASDVHKGRAAVSILVPNDSDVAFSSTPVTSGIPFPSGHLADSTKVCLLDAGGQAVPLQTESLCQWPDGSIRWLLLDFQTDLAPKGLAQYRLEYGLDVESADTPDSPVTVSEDNGRIVVDTGALEAVFSADSQSILESLKLNGGSGLTFQHALLSLENYYGFPPARYGNRPAKTLQVETVGSMRTVIKAEGRYEPLSGFESGFAYVLRFHFYAGSSALKIEHTFVNTTPETSEGSGPAESAISRTSAAHQVPIVGLRTVSLHLPAPEGDGLRYVSGIEEDDPLAGDLAGLYEARLIQSTSSACRLFECASNGADGVWERMTDAALKVQHARAAGWAGVETSKLGLTVAVRDFWQQYPKAFRLSHRGIDLDLWTSERIPSVLGSDPPFNCVQGESKTHEIFLSFTSGEIDRDRAEAFQYHLRAETPCEWACSSGALAPIAPADPDRFPVYEAAVAALDVDRMGHGGGHWWHKIVTDGGEDSETYDRYGMENWGDNPLIWGYQTKYRMWSNCEYDLAHTAFQEYLRSGNSAYCYRAIQAARHVRDVDTIHHSTVAPETVGAPHHHWIHHCIQPPNSGHLWSEGIVEHYWLTGDKRSLDVVWKLGDYLIGLVDRGSHQGAERSAGWPLIALMGIYKATLDDRYLQTAKKLVDDVVAWQDPLRGVWSTAISEQPAYEGGTTFMVTILTRGLVRYWEVTGDERAAAAVVRAVDWMIDEAVQTPPGEPPESFYKQTPLCASIRPIQSEAPAYAYALTGDELYGEVARSALFTNLAGWKQGVPTSTMRDMPRVLHILGKEV